jgi:hypothetical protein
MHTRTGSLRPQARIGRWGDGDTSEERTRPLGASLDGSRTVLVVLAVAALAVAFLVARLVDVQVTGEYALAFRALWWMMLAFNVIDAFVQRSRLESWNTLLLKYVMVGVTYAILV